MGLRNQNLIETQAISAKLGVPSAVLARGCLPNNTVPTRPGGKRIEQRTETATVQDFTADNWRLDGMFNKDVPSSMLSLGDLVVWNISTVGLGHIVYIV